MSNYSVGNIQGAQSKEHPFFTFDREIGSRCVNAGSQTGNAFWIANLEYTIRFLIRSQLGPQNSKFSREMGTIILFWRIEQRTENRGFQVVDLGNFIRYFWFGSNLSTSSVYFNWKIWILRPNKFWNWRSSELHVWYFVRFFTERKIVHILRLKFGFLTKKSARIKNLHGYSK